MKSMIKFFEKYAYSMLFLALGMIQTALSFVLVLGTQLNWQIVQRDHMKLFDAYLVGGLGLTQAIICFIACWGLIQHSLRPQKL